MYTDTIHMVDGRSLDVDLVLLALLEAPAFEVRGRELGLSTGLDSSHAQRAIRALEDRQWITIRVEDPAHSGGRRRLFYALTSAGRDGARARTEEGAWALRAVWPGWSAVEWRRDELARRDALTAIRDIAAGVPRDELPDDARTGVESILATAERLLEAWPTPTGSAGLQVTATGSREVA